jgi:IS1 family transposase
LGSWWDHVVIDTGSRLIVTLVVGRRTAETVAQAWADFYRRTDGMLPPLITTDAYAAYLTTILDTYGVRKEGLELTDEEKEEIDWESLPPVYFPVEISYATVRKVREQGRVVRVDQQVVLGTQEQVAEALEQGTTAPTINTSYVERYHGSHRRSNARKARKVYTFSKALPFHVAVTWLCVVFYNFGWAPRTLREKVRSRPRRYRYRTPAMVAGLASQPWSMAEILTYPLFPILQSPAYTQQSKVTPDSSDGG